jgi:hypothetical protein
VEWESSYVGQQQLLLVCARSVPMKSSEFFSPHSFVEAGGVPAKNLAGWDSRSFTALGDFNGEVTSIASIGEFVYVGGEFTSVSGIAVNRIARYQQGRWYPLHQVDIAIVWPIF